MKKILFIANKSDIFSGGQISMLELIAGLDRTRFRPVVLCPGEGELAEKVRSMDVSVHIWEMRTARTIRLRSIKKKAEELRGIVERCGADVVHTNGSRAQFYAALATKKMSVYLVWHVRESVRDISFYDQFLAGSADKIICVSEAVRDKRFGANRSVLSKTEVIYNGVNTCEFTRDDNAGKVLRQEQGILEDDILLGMVGLLVPIKGHLFLFDAMERLIGKYPGIKLLVVGKIVDGGYSGRLRGVVDEKKLRDAVIFMTERDDVRTVLSAMDIFVLPSQREGFSRVLLEAMSCELPVVASDVTGNNEAVIDGESGVLVPFGDVKNLAKAVSHFIDDADHAKRLGNNARNRVKELFSIEKHVIDMQRFYDNLM